jgi:membrane protease YdiL (CAAX protease family)
LPLPQNDLRTGASANRPLQFAVVAASLTWFAAANELAARAARGLVVRLQWSDEFQLLQALFLLFLLALGTMLLHSIASGPAPLRRVLGLPRRPSSLREWATGAAIGWGIILSAILPAALAGRLHVNLWLAPRSFYLVFLNLITIALLALASEVGFRGYAFRRLIDAVGPAWATAVISLLFGIAGTFNQDSTILTLITGAAFGLILCLAWLRTHGLWLSWGIHFAWIATLGVLFGLPVRGIDNLSAIIQTRATGPIWLTGGDIGIEAAPWTLIVLLGSIAAVVLVTSDWAWDYTRKPLIPAGYPMDVPPPAAHAAMETQVAPAPQALVQILPTTPQSRSVEPDR